MSRKYTRDEQRKYKARRQAQVKLVTDRLMGKGKNVWQEHDGRVGDLWCNSVLYYNSITGVTSQPRIGAVINGMKGV